jgi:hypothetical protein
MASDPSATAGMGAPSEGVVAGSTFVYVEGSMVRAFDLGTGVPRWHRQVNTPPPILGFQGSLFGSPDAVVVGRDVVSTPTGRELLRLGSALSSDAGFATAANTLAVSSGGLVVGYDLSAGRRSWQVQVDRFMGRAVDGGVLYLDDNSFVHHTTTQARKVQRVDLRTGHRLSDLDLPAPMDNGRVLAAIQGVVIVGSDYPGDTGMPGEDLYGLDETSGSVRWKVTGRVDWIDRAGGRFCAIGTGSVACHYVDSGKNWLNSAGYAQVSFMTPGGGAVGWMAKDPGQTRLVGLDLESGTHLWQSPGFALLSTLPRRQTEPAPVYLGVACADTTHPKWTFFPPRYTCNDTHLVAIDW